MLAKRSYVIDWNCQQRRWQLCTTTGFVLLESASRREVAALCARLNRQFPRSHRRQTSSAGPRVLGDISCASRKHESAKLCSSNMA